VIRRQLTTCPQLLAYSLEQRIKPRHRLLHSYGLKLGLHSMLSPTDLAFYQVQRGSGRGRGRGHGPGRERGCGCGCGCGCIVYVWMLSLLWTLGLVGLVTTAVWRRAGSRGAPQLILSYSDSHSPSLIL
jgi:hypothetical protein